LQGLRFKVTTPASEHLSNYLKITESRRKTRKVSLGLDYLLNVDKAQSFSLGDLNEFNNEKRLQKYFCLKFVKNSGIVV